jgi:8-amino-7-oxononanoate synthase
MRTILVTGSDTGVGKTRVVATLARMLGEGGNRIQIVKIVETGVGPGVEGDASRARRLSGTPAQAATLAAFPAALSPPAAAAAAGTPLRMEELATRAAALPPCDWRICEGAGGIATPVDDRFRDWADVAAAIEADATVIVVPDRLGAINQARLAFGRAALAGLKAGIWLNAAAPVEAAVAASNRAGLRGSGLPVWADQAHGAELPGRPDEVLEFLGFDRAGEGPGGAGSGGAAGTAWLGRCRAALEERDRKKLRRSLRVTPADARILNLADNDYLGLARDPAVAAAAAAAAAHEGTSASASPLITGWREPHARLVETLCAWHRFPYGMLWSSGYSANAALLAVLPGRGDLVLADRLVHHSMIAGLTRSDARFHRYAHLDLDEVERRLEREAGGRSRPAFVVTESVFSMDGDYPDLNRLAALRRKHGFCWILDEAHALGWYGAEGAGLASAGGVEGDVDILVGTLGKTLASGGAYTLFRDEAVRDTLVNFAGEFIYSTALPPANAAAAGAAVARVRVLAADQPRWHAASRGFRAALRAAGWASPEGESPVVPVRLDNEDTALALAASLRAAGILTAAVRPPTVPPGTSRLRFSLKSTFGPADSDRVVAAMGRP